MSKREDEKKKALAALSRIAYSSAMPAAAPSPVRATPPTRPAPPARPTKAAPPARATAASADAEKRKRQQMADRAAKADEARSLKQRRANELARGSDLQWRGMDPMGVPASIRRTGFDRQEATMSQKIQDVLGDTKEKAGRAKAREKGKRAGGKR